MKYSLHGLVLDTPFSCPELLPASGEADVTVTLGRIDRLPLDWREESVCYKASPGRYLLSVPGVADYFVEDGNAVTIVPAPDADEDALRLFFYQEVMGALLMQRGCLLLNGFAVERDGKAYAFTGPTPSGKTMLATELCRQGYKLISDGFFCLSGNEKPLIQPGMLRLMLWEKSLRELGIPREGLKPVRNGMRRYYIPLEGSFCAQPLPPSCVYISAFSNREGWSVDTPKGMEKLFALLSLRYHPELEAPLDIMKAQHQLAASLADSTDIRVVRCNDSHVSFGEYLTRMKKELEATAP